MGAIRDGVFFYWFKLRYVEDGVNRMEVRRKFEREGMGAWLSYDFEWAKEFLCKFRSRTSSLDVLGAKEDPVTYFERRSQIPMLVRLDLVARLCLGDFVA